MLHVPPSFDYLGASDCDRVLQAWGNPASPDTLGMLLPEGASVFAEAMWAVVITYTGLRLNTPTRSTYNRSGSTISSANRLMARRRSGSASLPNSPLRCASA